MATELQIEIRELVKERYAEVARGAGDCCADSCCESETNLYTLQEVEGLPTEAVMASAGCGNPTAIGALNAGETVVDFGAEEASTASWRRGPSARRGASSAWT